MVVISHKVQAKISHREKEKRRSESKRASPPKERGHSRSLPVRKGISFDGSPPRPTDLPGSSLALESADEGQLVRFRRILCKELAEDDLPSHVACAFFFLAERAALELEYGLGPEKAKVAEMEDKLEGVEEERPLQEKGHVEISSLQHDMTALRDEMKAMEVAGGKEVDALMDCLRRMKGKAEAAEAEVEVLKKGVGLDFEVVVESPNFAPIFEILKGMVVTSMRKTLATAYRGFNFGPLDVAMQPVRTSQEKWSEQDRKVENEKERAPSSPKEKTD